MFTHCQILNIVRFILELMKLVWNTTYHLIMNKYKDVCKGPMLKFGLTIFLKQFKGFSVQ